eukprot:10250196-Alexandrium_andersonii.AAC.1
MCVGKWSQKALSLGTYSSTRSLWTRRSRTVRTVGDVTLRVQDLACVKVVLGWCTDLWLFPCLLYTSPSPRD